MPVHARDGRRKTEVIAKPEASSSANLKREGLVFALVTAKQSAFEIVLCFKVTECAQQAWLPANSQAAERPFFAELAAAAHFEKAKVHVPLGIPPDRVEAARNPIIPAKDA